MTLTKRPIELKKSFLFIQIPSFKMYFFELTNTTTLNSFKKNHKAHITGLELGF